MPKMTKAFLEARKKDVLDKVVRQGHYNTTEQQKKRKEEYKEKDDTRKRVP